MHGAARRCAMRCSRAVDPQIHGPRAPGGLHEPVVLADGYRPLVHPEGVQFDLVRMELADKAPCRRLWPRSKADPSAGVARAL